MRAMMMDTEKSGGYLFFSSPVSRVLSFCVGAVLVGVLEQNRFIVLFKSFANLHHISADNKRMGMLVISV